MHKVIILGKEETPTVSTSSIKIFVKKSSPSTSKLTFSKTSFGLTVILSEIVLNEDSVAISLIRM